MSGAPLIVGLGGTTRACSSSEMVLRATLAEVEARGGRTALVAGPDLVLPLYAPESPARDDRAQRLVALLREADGVIVASPGYHGSISGMIKNALDYIEDMAGDPIPYLDGRAFGCIACAYGWQATGSTLAALRSIAHALRAWPTPLGIAMNAVAKPFDEAGVCQDPGLTANVGVMAQQMLDFSAGRRALRATLTA